MRAIDEKLTPLKKEIKEINSNMTTLKNSLNDHVSVAHKIRTKLLKKLIYYQLINDQH